MSAGEAAVLVSNRYAALLEQVSLLPSCYAQASTWLPRLREGDEETLKMLTAFSGTSVIQPATCE